MTSDQIGIMLFLAFVIAVYGFVMRSIGRDQGYIKCLTDIESLDKELYQKVIDAAKIKAVKKNLTK